MSKLSKNRSFRVGATYKIVLEDCCIQGEITAVYKGYDEVEDMTIFDTCAIGPGWGAWSAEEVK